MMSNISRNNKISYKHQPR